MGGAGGSTAGGSIHWAWRVRRLLAAVNARFGKRKAEAGVLGLGVTPAVLSSSSWYSSPKPRSFTCPAWTPARTPRVWAWLPRSRPGKNPFGLGVSPPHDWDFHPGPSLLACDFFPTPQPQLPLAFTSTWDYYPDSTLPSLVLPSSSPPPPPPSQCFTHLCLATSSLVCSSASTNWRPTLSEFGPKLQPLAGFPPSILPL